MASLSTGDKSTGSLWNKNSWHWEEKDYNKASQAKLREALDGLKMQLDNGNMVSIHSVEPSGFASVSVRKGKKVVVFEFTISMKFDSPVGSGSIKIPEFSNDELEPTLRVELASGDESVKDYLRKEGAKAIRTRLAQFVEFINSVETGNDLLQADKERREREHSAAQQAEVAKGEEKRKIAESVKAREQEQISHKPIVEASVWNVNSYHWESKKLDKWAAEHITNMLLSKSSDFSEVIVTGEAENSVRKGKIISIFNVKINGRFKSVAFAIPVFSNEEGDEDCEDPKVVCENAEIKKEITTMKPLHGFLAALKSQQ